MPQKVLGIDIGSYSVKVAELARSFRSFEFVGFYEKRVVENELLSKEESIALALQSLIDDHNLQWETACCGFPTQMVSSRVLTFPFGNRKKIEQALGFEIETYIPFDINDVVFDHAILSSGKDSSQVMGIYTPKKEVAKILSMLDGVGIDPQHLCVEGVEMVNLVNLGMVPPEGGFTIIDIGHEKTTITIFHGKKLGYVRSVSVAGKAITEAIAKKLEVPYAEAERYKIEIGQLNLMDGEVVDDLTRDVNAAIKQVIQDLMLHVRQTLFSYRETEGVPVEGIYLCGGTSRLIGLDNYISDFLKQNVTFLNCADFHFTKLERAEAHRHVIPQALALALREVAGPGLPDVNFRLGEFAFTGNVEQLGGGLRKFAIIGGIIVFLALLNFTLKYYTLKQQLDKIQDNGAELVMQAIPNTPKKTISTTTAALSLLKGKRAEINERINVLAGAMGVSPLDILKKISELMPAKDEITIDVKDMNIAQDRVTLSGETNSFENVDKIKLEMERSKRFKNVSTGNVRKGTKGEIKFDLSMEIEEEGEGSDGS
ncbi:MAG: pilus assembly protein PilM [Pseudomonadota bacterium]